jgi:hypothetical protein
LNSLIVSNEAARTINAHCEILSSGFRQSGNDLLRASSLSDILYRIFNMMDVLHTIDAAHPVACATFSQCDRRGRPQPSQSLAK